MKNHIVILHQYKRALLCPSHSVNCLIIETLLRLHQIPYKSHSNYYYKGQTDKIPLIQYGKTKVHGFEAIMAFLQEKFSIKLQDYDELNLGLYKAFQCFIFAKLLPLLELDRYSFHTWNDYNQLVPGLMPNYLRFYNYYKWKKMGRKMLQNHIAKNGNYTAKNGNYIAKNGSHVSEIVNFVICISQLLADDAYFFAGKTCNLMDILIFAIWSQILFVTPCKNEFRKMALLEKCKNVMRHHTKMKDLLFPDWTHLST